MHSIHMLFTGTWNHKMCLTKPIRISEWLFACAYALLLWYKEPNVTRRVYERVAFNPESSIQKHATFEASLGLCCFTFPWHTSISIAFVWQCTTLVAVSYFMCKYIARERYIRINSKHKLRPFFERTKQREDNREKKNYCIHNAKKQARTP